ncbi:MarR family winged helix-turn-helix transcriptional regulator [Ectobacillus panaciterrae]|uniref:MarR family winged helix-turn-helix transcriptional regulator n=1 Tax=Ectobacillus panaciterrae TaxID=363872 RepID=UPI00042956AF|nr:MarR family transcriptional regulator [Ectobacillus panaciterrae]
MENRKLLVQNLVLTFKEQTKKARLDVNSVLKQYIPLNEFYVLTVLFKYNHQMMVSEIADKLHVSTSHITAVSDKLIEKELIARERSAADRRIVYLSITDKGKELAEEMKEILNQRYEETFKNFTNEEIEMFSYLLKKIKVEKTS